MVLSPQLMSTYLESTNYIIYNHLPTWTVYIYTHMYKVDSIAYDVYENNQAYVYKHWVFRLRGNIRNAYCIVRNALSCSSSWVMQRLMISNLARQPNISHTARTALEWVVKDLIIASDNGIWYDQPYNWLTLNLGVQGTALSLNHTSSNMDSW